MSNNTLLRPEMIAAWATARFRRRWRITFEHRPEGTVMHATISGRRQPPVPIEGHEAFISTLEAFETKYLRPLAEAAK